MSVTVTQQLTQQTVTVTGNPVENNVTVTVSNARGPAGPSSVTSATTSDGTADLSLAAATVSGTLTAPTAATTTSTTQVATTAFVQQEIASGVAVAKNLEFLAHNGSGATIAKGSIVYINGAVGGVPRITKSQANNDTNSARTIGFVKADIANGENGFIIIEGELLNVSTADSSGIIGAGIQIYLSPTIPGAFTRTKPSAPNHLVYVGVVVTASTGANLDGKILVGIQNGYELDEIHDVSITTPAAKQVIKRNAGNTLWVNEAIVSADVSDATSAATASTLVRRDASGGADFSGTVNLNTGVIVDLRFEDYQAAVGATFLYNGTSASDHRIALGAGTTGATLFGAADAAAARTTLGLATADSPTFGGADFFTSTTTTLNVYNTLSGANFERLSFRWVSNVARIGTAKGGTGTARDLVLETDGTERVRVAGTTGIVTTTQLIAQVLQTTGNGFYAGETPIRLGVNNSMYFRALASSDVVSLTNSLGGTNYRDLALRNLTASGTITATTTHPTASAITATQGVYSSFLGANQSGGGFIGCSISGVGVGFAHPTSSSFFPCNASGALTTGVMNLGRADYRFNNYFGTNGNFSGTLAVTGATTLGATTITSAGSFTIGDNATASLNATLSRNGAGALLLNSTNSAGVNIYGKLQFSNDNVADIGNVATHRPRNLYVGTGVFAANITVTGASTLTGGATFGGSTQQAATRIALGAGTTGATLFGAADAAAARAALGIQIKTGTSTGLAAVGTADITGLTGYDLEANTWYKLELQYLWTSTSSNFQINFVTTGTFLRGGTTPAIGQANIGAAALSQSGFINDTSINLRGNVGESRTNIPAFGYAYFKTGTAGTGKVQLQLLAGTTLSTIGSSCAVLTKQN